MAFQAVERLLIFILKVLTRRVKAGIFPLPVSASDGVRSDGSEFKNIKFSERENFSAFKEIKYSDSIAATTGRWLEKDKGPLF